MAATVALPLRGLRPFLGCGENRWIRTAAAKYTKESWRLRARLAYPLVRHSVLDACSAARNSLVAYGVVARARSAICGGQRTQREGQAFGGAHGSGLGMTGSEKVGALGLSDSTRSLYVH